MGWEGTFANPKDSNFSQSIVGREVVVYIHDMANNNWDWSKSGPIRVMDVDGQLVTYDNRRLMAAQNADLTEVPVKIVDGDNWRTRFKACFAENKNRTGVRLSKKGFKKQSTKC